MVDTVYTRGEVTWEVTVERRGEIVAPDTPPAALGDATLVVGPETSSWGSSSVMVSSTGGEVNRVATGAGAETVGVVTCKGGSVKPLATGGGAETEGVVIVAGADAVVTFTGGEVKLVATGKGAETERVAAAGAPVDGKGVHPGGGVSIISIAI